MRVTCLIGLMVLIAACAIVAVEHFSANQTKYPMPLADWVYDAVVKNDKIHTRWYFRNEG